jgi:hypothetical protein
MDFTLGSEVTTTGSFRTAIPARYSEQRARVLSILKRWDSTPAWVSQRAGHAAGRPSSAS